MDRVALGVIGVGRMGKNHCRVFSTLRYGDLIGLHDLNGEIASQIAQNYEASYFLNVDELLSRVDGISIATPTQDHFPLAMKALDRGLHVFIEKPITNTVSEAEALVEAAARTGKVVMIGHIERFNPVYVELKNVLENMTVLAINFRRLSPFAGSNVDVDVVQDLMIHDLDLVRDLVGGSPNELSAEGLTAYNQAIDHANVNMHFCNGPLVTLTGSRLTEQKVRQIEITALEGYVVADLLNKSIAIHHSTTGKYLNTNHHRGVQYRQESVIERIHVPTAEPLALELQHFVDCIRRDQETDVPAADGLAALLLAEQIRTQIYGKIVDVARLRKADLLPQPAH